MNHPRCPSCRNITRFRANVTKLHYLTIAADGESLNYTPEPSGNQITDADIYCVQCGTEIDWPHGMFEHMCESLTEELEL